MSWPFIFFLIAPLSLACNKQCDCLEFIHSNSWCFVLCKSLFHFPQSLHTRGESSICSERRWLTGLPTPWTARFAHTGGREGWWDHLLDSSITVPHKPSSRQRANPSTFSCCLRFLIVSVLMLMRWSREAGKLKKNFLCTPLYGYRPQMAWWPKTLALLRRKKKVSSSEKKRVTSPQV